MASLGLLHNVHRLRMDDAHVCLPYSLQNHFDQVRYRIVPPHIYISICILSWGILASLQAVATSFTFLVVLRALLGVGEAAFGPGVPFYLSFFFRRNELALRTGLFISASPL